jgi:hypothetical protein
MELELLLFSSWSGFFHQGGSGSLFIPRWDAREPFDQTDLRNGLDDFSKAVQEYSKSSWKDVEGGGHLATPMPGRPYLEGARALARSSVFYSLLVYVLRRNSVNYFNFKVPFVDFLDNTLENYKSPKLIEFVSNNLLFYDICAYV